MKPGSNSVEDHLQLSHNRHPVDDALVGAGSLWPFLESSIMSVLCDVHQQVFSKHLVILQQFYGFVWVSAVLFKIIFIWQSCKLLLKTCILHLKTC